MAFGILQGFHDKLMTNSAHENVLYSHLLIHVEIYIYMLDTYRRNELIRCKHKRRKDNDKDARRNKRRMKEDAGRLL